MNTDQHKGHKGEILKAVVKESGISIDVLMRKLGYSSRNTYYRHIESAELSDDILNRYGKALKHNFFLEQPEDEFASVGESPSNYLATPNSIEEAINQRDFYWTKYQEQLEEYRKLFVKYEALLKKSGS